MKKLLFALYLIFIGSLIIAYLIIPKEYRDFIKQMCLWILPVIEWIFLLFVLFMLYKIIKNYKSIDDSEELEFIQKLRLALKPIITQEKILEILLQDISIIYYSLFLWFGKKEIKSKNAFTYHKTSGSKSFTIVIVVLSLVDIGIIHYLIQIWNDTVAWIVTLLNLYMILIFIASYKSMRLLPHELKDDYIIIRNGNTASVEFQLDNIESIKKAKEKEFWEKIPKDVYYFVAPLDIPHYEISLKNPVQMIGFYGRKKTISKVIFRLDQPNEFLEELNKKGYGIAGQSL